MKTFSMNVNRYDRESVHDAVDLQRSVVFAYLHSLVKSLLACWLIDTAVVVPAAAGKLLTHSHAYRVHFQATCATSAACMRCG